MVLSPAELISRPKLKRNFIWANRYGTRGKMWHGLGIKKVISDIDYLWAVGVLDIDTFVLVVHPKICQWLNMSFYQNIQSFQILPHLQNPKSKPYSQSISGPKQHQEPNPNRIPRI